MCVCVCMRAHICVYVSVGKKRVMDSLELQLQVELSYLTCVPGTKFRAHDHFTISLAPKWSIVYFAMS